MPKRVLTGTVTSDKMLKTRRVELDRMVKHARYGKYVRSRTVCYAHDEENESQVGDLVEIIESQPMSKLKRWKLVRVVKKNTEVDLTALRAARKGASEAEAEALAAAQVVDSEVAVGQE